MRDPRDETIKRLIEQVGDISRQLRALQRLDVSPPPASIVTYTGTPTTGQLAQWGGAGTLTHSGYAGSAVTRYSGSPAAGNYTYWTANGTVADSGFGTSQLPRYSGAPTAGQITYWTAAGTVAAAGFGTADVATLAGTQTLTNKTLTTPVISATGFTNAQHAHTGATSGGQLTTAALSNLSTLVQTTGAQSIAGDKTFTDDIIANGALRLGTSSETISSGVINYTACMIAVDTEGAAGTDDLTTINGGATGDLLFIRCAANARNVVVKHGTGNIFCGADRTLNSVTDVICFIYLGSWRCISFADNA